MPGQGALVSEEADLGRAAVSEHDVVVPGDFGDGGDGRPGAGLVGGCREAFGRVEQCLPAERDDHEHGSPPSRNRTSPWWAVAGTDG